ncbi:MAG: hypothetical protein LQ342_003269 [Letrouitia transgressa]|nr:MAG: hypothetical protein LQ342_003269 [Letrouitia transgressa]
MSEEAQNSYRSGKEDVAFNTINDARKRHQSDRLFSPSVLIRGKSKCCDTLLDWIDAILNEILQHRLDSAQISIIADKSRPADILEGYRFDFAYSDSNVDANRHLKDITLSSVNGKQLTIKNTRAAIEAMATRLIAYNVAVPELPSRFTA